MLSKPYFLYTALAGKCRKSCLHNSRRLSLHIIGFFDKLHVLKDSDAVEV